MDTDEHGSQPNSLLQPTGSAGVTSVEDSKFVKTTPKVTKRSRPKLSHVASDGSARMVNVGAKPVQQRRAVASGRLVCAPATIRALRKQALPKGDVLAVANIAGVQAVKQAAHLIPLCHPLPIEHVELTFAVKPAAIDITCTVATGAKTGVEMEALTGVSVAALTLYDMCKAVDKSMRVEGVHVVEKTKR